MRFHEPIYKAQRLPKHTSSIISEVHENKRVISGMRGVGAAFPGSVRHITRFAVLNDSTGKILDARAQLGLDKRR